MKHTYTMHIAIIFGILVQNSFGNSNCYKVGQLSKKLKKIWIDEKNN
jgi:hypothetical protein